MGRFQHVFCQLRCARMRLDGDPAALPDYWTTTQLLLPDDWMTTCVGSRHLACHHNCARTLLHSHTVTYKKAQQCAPNDGCRFRMPPKRECPTLETFAAFLVHRAVGSAG